MEPGIGDPNRIPFRPMDFGEILDYSFRLYRQTWKTLIPIGILSALPSIILQGLMQTSLKAPENNFVFRLMDGVQRGDYSGFVILGVVYLAVVVAMIFIYPLVNGAITAICSRKYLGEQTTWLEALQIAGASYWPLLGTGVLFGLMMIVAFPLLILGGLLIFAIFTIPAGYAVLMTLFAFNSQAIVVEGTPGGVPAFTRSAKLVSGRFWPLLGLGLVFGLLTYVLAMVIGTVVVLPITLVQNFVSPNPVWGWIAAILNGLGTAVMMPFTYVGKTLAYYDTRMRKEGFDLEMLSNAGLNPDRS